MVKLGTRTPILSPEETTIQRRILLDTGPGWQASDSMTTTKGELNKLIKMSKESKMRR